MSRTIRVVAAFEALKGAVVLLASSAVLSLAHRDLHALALALVEHTHLNPASHYPQIFLDAATRVHDARLWTLAAGAAGYALLRFVEAYGLYRGRAWAELLAAVSGAIYVPFELMAFWRAPTALHLGLLVLNLGVVAVMLASLRRRRAPVAAPGH